jgi:cation:H+ antiporter
MTRWVPIVLALLVTLPALGLRVAGQHTAPGFDAFVFGVAILGAAFLLTWAAEVAQVDISQGLALAFLALIAVLPEYAVDLYFAWQAPHHPEYTAYATANMTGANRLLIGIAWPLIIVLFWWKSRRRELHLPRSRCVELVFLILATLYSFVIPLKGTISLLDTVVLVGCFAGYVWRTAKAEVEEPELLGPAQALGVLRPALRRTAVVLLFVFAAAVIIGSAERFAEALIHVGKAAGIDEFLLVQWLAPLASEAPEVVIACILTLRGDAQAGMGAMISSKVNQWTLLVGTLPLVYSISAGGPSALHLDARQVEEILLTAAQSLFAVAVLANLSLSLLEAGLLFALFTAQLFFPDEHIRYGFSAAYIALGLLTIFRRTRDLPGLFREGLFAPVAGAAAHPRD